MIAQDLLEILRCPYCAASSTRQPGDDPGQLELVREYWLVCQQPGCGRKYPIVDDIPVMFVETGDKYVATPVASLPVPPPPA